MNFVLISYDANFLGIACLNKILESIQNSNISESNTIYVVNNKKTKEQIDHFKSFFQDVSEKIAKIIYLEPYCNFLENNNKYTKKGILHGEMIAWLVKYVLPENETFLFLDHDCFVESDFYKYIHDTVDNDQLKENMFIFQKQERIKEHGVDNYTRPGFFINTFYKSFFLEIPDIMWQHQSNWHYAEKDDLNYTAFHCNELLDYIDFHRKSTRKKDTLSCCVWSLIKKNPFLSKKIKLIKFDKYQHISLKGDKKITLEELIFINFTKEYFQTDQSSLRFLLFIIKLIKLEMIKIFEDLIKIDLREKWSEFNDEIKNEVIYRYRNSIPDLDYNMLIEKINLFEKGEKND